MNTLPAGVSTREFLVFFYKYRLRLVMAFLLPFLAAVMVSFLPVPRYDATATLIIRLGSEYVYQPEVGETQSGQGATIPFDRDQIFKSEVAILTSDDLHKEVIETIGIETLFPELLHPTRFGEAEGDVHKYLRGKLQAWGVVGEEPKITAAEKQARQLSEAVVLFDKRLDVLLEKESAVINLSFQHKDPATASQALDTLLRLYFEKRKQLFIEPRAELAESQVETTRRHALETANAVEEFKRTYQIHSLPDQRAELLQARSELQKQATMMIDKSVNQRIAAYDRQLNDLDTEERQFDDLQREAQIANDSYALSSHRLDEAKAFEDLQRERASSVRVIQQPMTAADPKKLQPLILMAGLFVSLVNVLLVAAVTEFLKTGFITPERMAATIGLPVLATVPLRRKRLFGRG